MGICQGSSMSPEEREAQRAAQKRNKEIEKQLGKMQIEQEQIHKLLLLGAGESGKSTLFKQMVKIHGKGFSKEDRQGYLSIIHGNVVQSVKTLCEMTELLKQKYGADHELHPEIKVIADYFLSSEFKNDTQLSPELALRIEVLWKAPPIQATYRRRNEYQLTDSTDYFLNKINEISRPDYIPSEQDVLRSRVRTTGIVENHFEIEDNKFRMFDVGGQRNERKKWIHCFEDVTAVLFVAALSAYDMKLFEDEDVNRMVEALNLFDEIVNSPWFKKTSIILFLNKKDLFADKIERIPLTVCPIFSDYAGPQEYEPCLDAVQEVFEEPIHKANKQVYTQVTCATDSNQMEHVFHAVKDIVIRRSLQAGGLLN